MKLKISNAEVSEILAGENIVYPKYSTQVMNLANQNAQGTRAKVVGQMSELIQQFEGNGLEEWRKWYLQGHPEAIDKATDKVWNMIGMLKEAIPKITKELVKKWVEELVVVKTYAGLKFQNAILHKIGKKQQLSYKLATPAEESKGIDGHIGGKPVSIKPMTYKSTKQGLNEEIEVPIIYYSKTKSGITIEFDPTVFS
jgi:hypothetical protein